MNLRKIINIVFVSLFLFSFFGAALVKCDVLDNCGVIEALHHDSHEEHEHKSQERHSCEYCADCICKGNFENYFSYELQSNLPVSFLKFYTSDFPVRDYAFPIEQPPQNLI